MIVQRRGGMTEFIPSPQEKREGLVRDHSFNLIENLHQRLYRLETELGLPLEDAEDCSTFLEKLKQDESENIDINIRVLLKNTKELQTRNQNK